MSLSPQEPPTAVLSHLSAALVYLAHARLLSAAGPAGADGPHLARVHHELVRLWVAVTGRPMPEEVLEEKDASGDS